MDSTYSPSSSSHGPLKLSNEEIHHLLNRVSSDEQAELSAVMKSCTSEVTMSRGLPITAAILGSLYFARTRLPTKYHFGPKGWPFYAIVGISSMTAVNVAFMGMCRDRIQPKVEELWRKYQQPDGRTTYDQIRQQHRLGADLVGKQDSHDTLQHKDNKLNTYTSPTYERDFDVSPGAKNMPPPQFLYEDVPYMSGTPKSPKSDQMNGPEFS